MYYKHLHVFYRIINIWLAFILFLVVISNLPHDRIPGLSWLNSSIYFLMFLLAIHIAARDTNNRFIFINIGMFALFHSLSFVDLFIGDANLVGNDVLAYSLFGYQELILIFLFAFSIVFICIKYQFKDLKPLAVYGISLLVILPVFLWHFYPYLVDNRYILHVDVAEFYKRFLYFNFLPLFFIISYGFILYKYDRSLGEHINTIIVCFFIMLLMDITNTLGYVYKITIFSLSQYVLLLNLSFFLLILFKRLNYMYSEFGQFYDRLVVSGNDMGVPIKRKRSSYTALLNFTKLYFYQRRNALGFASLVLIFCINYFVDVSPFVKLNLAALSFGILVVFFYIAALYHRRLEKGRLLTITRKHG